MAESPPLRTARLVLRPLGREHLVPHYIAWLNDPEVVRYSDQRHQRHTLATCQGYVESFAGTPNHLWAIEAQDEALGFVGTMTAYVDAPHGVADLGILLGERKAWGRGLGSEAWQAAIGYLFREVGIRKVTAGTVEANRPMLAMMRRAGMVEDGRRLRQCVVEGREVDVVHAALFREAFLATAAAATSLEPAATEPSRTAVRTPASSTRGP